jgi:hypothetical protein
MNIALTPCKSSNIQATGYDPATNTLAVQFKHGKKVYHYSDVPGDLHKELHKAESIGKFIGAKVVGKFKHTTIDLKEKS